MDTSRRWLRRIPGARWLHSTFVRSEGSWIFDRRRLEWLSRPGALDDFPWLYRIFAAYCRVAPRTGRRVFGAEPLHRLLSFKTRLLGLRDHARVELTDTAVHLLLTDPRSLVVPLEIERSPQIAVLDEELAPGDTFVDVGANHGSFSALASKRVGASGLVVAFEPQPALAPLVHRTLTEAAAAPFQVHELACSDHDGESDFFIPHATSGTAGLLSSFSGGSPGRRVRVRVRRFDDVVAWETFPGRLLIKLDVEGSEAAFLRGAVRALAARRPKILMEVNPSAMEAGLRGTLLDLGYARARAVGSGEPEELTAMDWSRRHNVLVE